MQNGPFHLRTLDSIGGRCDVGGAARGLLVDDDDFLAAAGADHHLFDADCRRSGCPRLS
jgi:hypothetical protein